jgi:hypothetical protein
MARIMPGFFKKTSPGLAAHLELVYRGKLTLLYLRGRIK